MTDDDIKLRAELLAAKVRIKELEELLAEAHAYIMLGLHPTADILKRIADIINMEEHRMRKEFVEVKTGKEAEELCPWASKIVSVVGGYWAFESWDDYEIWRNQK